MVISIEEHVVLFVAQQAKQTLQLIQHTLERSPWVIGNECTVPVISDGSILGRQLSKRTVMESIRNIQQLKRKRETSESTVPSHKFYLPAVGGVQPRGDHHAHLETCAVYRAASTSKPRRRFPVSRIRARSLETARYCNG
jgi:hypothetical protein